MSDLTLDELRRHLGALVLELWAAGKTVAELQQSVHALTPPAPPQAEPVKLESVRKAG